ncbi:hypothetical protein BJ165DRAFT_936890 [Panaeolus papilionaceus]|nr:hypothetical protein BJ165DRAFT_936890 [Panaeolus papilionaceus]
MSKQSAKGKTVKERASGERHQRTLKVEDDSLSLQELRRLLVETRQTLMVIQAEHTSLRMLLECIVYKTSPPPRYRGRTQDPISIPVHDRSTSKRCARTESESDGSAGSHTTSDLYSDKETAHCLQLKNQVAEHLFPL